MPEIPLRELRNDTSGVLRRVEDGEQFTVTINGRPVAQRVRDLLAVTSADDDWVDPWKKAELRWSDEP